MKEKENQRRKFSIYQIQDTKKEKGRKGRKEEE